MTGKTGITGEKVKTGETGETGGTSIRSHGMKLRNQMLRSPGQVSTRFNRNRGTYRLRFMSVHPDQAETILLALKLARAETGTKFDTVALEGICMNYLGGGKVAKKPKTIKELVRDLDPMKVLEALVDLYPDLEIAAICNRGRRRTTECS